MKMEETITIWERCKEGTLGFALFKTYKRHMDKTLEKDRKCVTKKYVKWVAQMQERGMFGRETDSQPTGEQLQDHLRMARRGKDQAHALLAVKGRFCGKEKKSAEKADEFLVDCRTFLGEINAVFVSKTAMQLPQTKAGEEKVHETGCKSSAPPPYSTGPYAEANRLLNEPHQMPLRQGKATNPGESQVLVVQKGLLQVTPYPHEENDGVEKVSAFLSETVQYLEDRPQPEPVDWSNPNTTQGHSTVVKKRQPEHRPMTSFNVGGGRVAGEETLLVIAQAERQSITRRGQDERGRQVESEEDEPGPADDWDEEFQEHGAALESQKPQSSTPMERHETGVKR